LFQCPDMTKCNSLLHSPKKNYKEPEQNNNKEEIKFKIVGNYLDHKENKMLGSPIFEFLKQVEK